MIKVGAACKWVDSTCQPVANAVFRGTTVKKVSSLSSLERHAWLLELVKHNLSALDVQLNNIATLPPALRMWRLSSDMLPLATHPIAAEFYLNADIKVLIDASLLTSGKFAREHKLRLSFHPGQFVVLGSQNPGIRENSRVELQYHCDCFARMGYHGWHPDGLAVNVHVGLKEANVPEMRALLTSSSEIANFTTLENDEFSWGSERIVDVFGDLVPLVLDVHHYWIHELKRLDPNDNHVRHIRDTWRGIQPKLHLAMSAPELCNANLSELDIGLLLKSTNRSKLRAHSQTAWHMQSMEYAAKFGFDIMWEGKDKNLGAYTIAKHLALI
jgi:UV DNA damage endonuclease